jgi:HAD superfamily hydrolase (TIGR01490 family)
VKRGIAFFDFDGTITTKDTLLEFLKFSKGRFRFYAGFLFNIFYLIAFKLKLISNQKAKEKILRFFFQGTPMGDFRLQCELFTKQVLPGLLRPKALEEIQKLKESGSIVVIVSASPENWIQDWAKSCGVELIASRLEVQDGRLTGKIQGANCHGKEKVRRIQEQYHISDFSEVYAYGDSKDDSPMLQLAHFAFYRPFRG